MAEQTVNTALGPTEAKKRPCVTAGLALLGAGSAAELEALPAGIAQSSGLDRAAAEHLARRYGTEAPDVAKLGATSLVFVAIELAGERVGRQARPGQDERQQRQRRASR